MIIEVMLWITKSHLCPADIVKVQVEHANIPQGVVGHFQHPGQNHILAGGLAAGDTADIPHGDMLQPAAVFPSQDAKMLAFYLGECMRMPRAVSP